MVTISKDSEKKPPFISIRVKFLLSYLAVLALVIIAMNTYPLYAARNLVFVTKSNAMFTRANQISISLGALDNLSPGNIANVIGVLDTEGISRITVVNANSDIVYYRVHSAQGGEMNAESLIRDSLKGNDSVRSRFSGGAFLTGCAVPVINRGKIVGSVYIYEYDPNEGAIIQALQRDTLTISLVIIAVSFVVALIFAGTFTSRIRKVLNGIQNVREGEYTYRVEPEGHDELTGLADEFNSLTMRLQKTEETRRRFVADASHDLKTPLASIQLLSDSILQNNDMDGDTVREFVSDIRNESERLAHTTGQLLNLTKLDYAASTVREPVDCGECCQKVIRMLKPIADEKDVALNMSVKGKCVILSSEDDVFQIISNLAENAIKYNKPGGHVSVDLSADDNVAIMVSDDGIGIPEQDIPYIFERFYRVDKSRNREIGGSGLGLAIVKDTTEKHGGTVEASRNHAGGMTFTVIFPIYSGAVL